MTLTSQLTTYLRDISLRRWGLLLIGLVCFGFGIALMVHANLGQSPWETLSQGISRRTGITIGIVSVLMGPFILLLWLPLRERPGLGTLLNILLIGTVTDLSLMVFPKVPAWHERVLFTTDLTRLLVMALGVVTIGVGSGLYLNAKLGAGPRDGLMMALVRKTGWSIRATRTTIEVCVLLIGFGLGGTVGLGTLAFALGIGPVVQTALKVIRPWAGK